MSGLGFSSARRINVVGCSGSGKSVFSRELARRKGLPFIEIDALFWGPNWTPHSEEVFLAGLEERLRADAWVLDGNYSRTTSIKWRRAELIVWLDYSFLTTMSRSLRRALYRIRTREELWPGTGNRETLRKLFSRDSILRWAWTSHGKIRRRYRQFMTDPDFAHLQFIHFAAPSAAEAWLQEQSESDPA